MPGSIVDQGAKVFCVGSLAKGGDRVLELIDAHPAVPPGDFLKAGDFEALVVFDRPDELRGFEKGFVSAGIQPGVAAAEDFDVEFAAFEVGAVDARDFQFAAGGGFDLFGDWNHIRVVEVESGDGEVRPWLRGLLLNGDGSAFAIELDDAEAVGIVDFIAEHGGSCFPVGGGLEFRREALAVENVVSEDKGAALARDEFLADDKCLGKTIGTGLFRIGDRGSKARSIAQQAAVEGEVVRCGNQEDFADSGQHEDGKRVVDHRFVIDRQQLLADGHGNRVETGAGAASEEDAFHG